jgi:hypothetical protein
MGSRITSNATNKTVEGITTTIFRPSNAFDSIRANCEFDSNEIDESDSQDEKHEEQRISTFLGIMIDRSDEDENADDSIRVNCEFNSNESDESE